MISKPVLFVALLSTAAVATAGSAPPGWRTVGWKSVGFGTDRDTIRLRGNARDRQIRVCAVNRSIHLIRLSVRFENGGAQELPVRRVLNAGTCTVPQELRGGRRNLAAVDMVYAKFARGTLPLVRVQAR